MVHFNILAVQLAKWLENNKDIGVLLLRLFIGIRLLYGVVDNVISWDHMLAFKDFLQLNGFPLPLLSAILSVYAQFICGSLIIIGLYIRFASAVMIVNFIIALVMVHRQDSFEAMTPALAILFANVLFVFYGAGRFSLSPHR